MLSGGSEYVFGSANGATVTSNSVQFVESGGIASGTTVKNTGYQYVEASGTTSGTMLSGGQYVFGTDVGTTISSGGYQFVEVGGTANSTKLSGGSEYVYGSANSAVTVNFVTAGQFCRGRRRHQRHDAERRLPVCRGQRSCQQHDAQRRLRVRLRHGQ